MKVRTRGNKFPLLLDNKFFIPILLALIILPTAFFIFTHQDKVYLRRVAQETMYFLKQQVLRYERFESRNAALDMTQVTNRAKMLAQSLQDKPERMTQAYLEDYAYAQRLDGIMVFDAQKQIEASSFIDKSIYDEMLKIAQTDLISSVLKFPMRSYMDQFISKEDNIVYSYTVVARQDKPGYIFAYRKESTQAADDSQSYMDGLFGSYGFELGGSVMIVKDGRVITSNYKKFKNKYLDDLLPEAKDKLHDEGNNIYSITYNGQVYYGVFEQFKDYLLVVFFPEKAVFANRFRDMVYVMLICIIAALLLIYLHTRSSQEHYKQLRKQYATIRAISSIFVTVFALNLRTKQLEVLQLPEGVELDIPKGTDGVKWLDQMIHANVKQEFYESVDIFNDLKALQARLQEQKSLYIEYQDKSNMWFSSLMVPQSYDDKGEITSVILVTRNITKEKERELAYQEQLRETACEAQSASIAKTDFLRRMSHDIRTPLNGILGLVEIANYHADDLAKQQEYRNKVMENAKILLDLSNDVLEMNKIESGKIVLAEKSFDMQQLVNSMSTMTEAYAKMRGLSFSKSFEGQHKQVVGSPVHLRQILTNLASNAVKYNKEHGSLAISCREIGCVDGVVQYEFICEDTGLGMSEEFQKHAFEMFVQEDSEARTSYIGTGLGLAIVKKLVDIMGGTLELESKKGVGTRFKVVLSFKVDEKPTAEKPAESKQEASLAGRHILLVEDNALNMKIEEFVLERAGAVLTKAVNGQEAVELFAASEPGAFDAILMDIMMPVMDGLTAARTIRALERSDAQTVPIVALSANAFAEDEAESQQAGINDYLSKPLNAQQLIKTLQKYLH